MNDQFTQALFDMVPDSPDLQRAILRSITGRGYSIPTGDITLSAFAIEDEAKRDKLVKAIQHARELKVSDLAKMLGELRVALTLEEVQGRSLSKEEETLRDIDITALATWTLVKWLGRVSHTDRS